MLEALANFEHILIRAVDRNLGLRISLRLGFLFDI